MANCTLCRHFFKLKHGEGCQKYRKIILSMDMDKVCTGFEIDIAKFKKGFGVVKPNA